jgi:hypothetical protein
MEDFLSTRRCTSPNHLQSGMVGGPFSAWTCKYPVTDQKLNCPSSFFHFVGHNHGISLPAGFDYRLFSLTV